MYDYVIIGSGFGGSVSALRLVEKGYRVLLLEKGSELEGRRFPEDELGRQAVAVGAARRLPRPLPDASVPARAGAGRSGGRRRLAHVREHLADPEDAASSRARRGPHSQTGSASSRRTTRPRARCSARRRASFLTPADRLLKEIAEERGHARGASRSRTSRCSSASPARRVPDPYFGGEGPERTGCIALRRVHDRLPVTARRTRSTRTTSTSRASAGSSSAPTPRSFTSRRASDGGYRVEAREGRSYLARKTRALRARRTSSSRAARSARTRCSSASRTIRTASPSSPIALGCDVRTNSESLIMVSVPGLEGRPLEGHRHQLALPDRRALAPRDDALRQRAPASSGCSMSPHARGRAGLRPAPPARLVHRPGASRPDAPRDVRRATGRASTMILLYMRSTEGTLRFKRGLVRRHDDRARARRGAARRPSPRRPSSPFAIAEKSGGLAMSPVYEPLFDIPTTAHILGGCCMGDSAETGRHRRRHRVFGYEGLYVIDGSTISANPGVNPSLTDHGARRARDVVHPRRRVRRRAGRRARAPRARSGRGRDGGPPLAIPNAVGPSAAGLQATARRPRAGLTRRPVRISLWRWRSLALRRNRWS